MRKFRHALVLQMALRAGRRRYLLRLMDRTTWQAWQDWSPTFVPHTAFSEWQALQFKLNIACDDVIGPLL